VARGCCLMKRSAVFLAAAGRYLTMLDFEIDSVLLARYLPAGTQLDSWYRSDDGRLCLSTGWCNWCPIG
jgi:hypothetical protein